MKIICLFLVSAVFAMSIAVPIDEKGPPAENNGPLEGFGPVPLPMRAPAELIYVGCGNDFCEHVCLGDGWVGFVPLHLEWCLCYTFGSVGSGEEQKVPKK